MCPDMIVRGSLCPDVTVGGCVCVCPVKTYHMTIVVNFPQVGVFDLAPTHSEHANMTYQQLLHLHCIQSKIQLLAGFMPTSYWL